MSNEPIAFLGCGMMAAPTIENLLEDGYSVSVWNRTREKAEALAAKGARVADTPAGAVEPGGLLFSLLADDAAARDVFESGAVIQALGPEGVHVSMSTISPACATELAEAQIAVGSPYVAAPILGRPDFVAARRQRYIVSGPEDGVARVAPVLDALGQARFNVGPDPAAAHVAKIAFNFLIAGALEAMSEAFVAVEKQGLDPRALHAIATGTIFGCPLYENYGTEILEQGYVEPLFKLSLGLKDVRLAEEMGAAVGAPMRLAELLVRRYQEAVDHGRGDFDWSGVADEVRAEAGLPTKK